MESYWSTDHKSNNIGSFIVGGGLFWTVCFFALIKSGVLAAQVIIPVIALIVVCWIVLTLINHVWTKMMQQNRYNENSLDGESQFPIAISSQSSYCNEVHQVEAPTNFFKILHRFFDNTYHERGNVNQTSNGDIQPPSYDKLMYESDITLANEFDEENPPPNYEEAVKH